MHIDRPDSFDKQPFKKDKSLSMKMGSSRPFSMHTAITTTSLRPDDVWFRHFDSVLLLRERARRRTAVLLRGT